jgi:uncharacterized protein
MQYSFRCYGHPNLRAKHTKTLEFTRAEELTPTGTCIIGVRANFDPAALRALSGKVRVTLAVGDLTETFTAVINRHFNHDEELVFRRGAFASPRTLGIYCTKVAIGVNRDLVARLRDPATEMLVTIEEIGKR